MGKLHYLVIFMIIPIVAAAQSSDQYSGGRMMGSSAMPSVIETQDLQTKFNKREWSLGRVSFRNEKPARQLSLLFDVYENTLYYLDNETVMEFLDPVYEFNIGIVKKNDSVILHFRNNYPAVNTNTAETFYEVLVDGNFQLLRCKAKTINLYKNLDEPEERRNYYKEQFYIFTPEKELFLVRKDRNQILESLPKYADKIDNLIQLRKIKIKTEEGLKALTAALNE